MEGRRFGHGVLNMKARVASPFTLALVFAACSSDPAGNAGGTAGSAGVSTGGTGGSAMAGQGGSLVTAGTMQGGASGSATTAGSGSGGNATAGSGGASGGSAGTAGGAGGSTGGAGGSPGVPAGCAADPHPICLDFENGLDANWTGGNAANVVTTDKAHGTKSYKAYTYPGGSSLKTTKFGSITNVMWGRFYLRMTPGPKPVPADTPGAPGGGHANLIAAYQGTNWWELGVQFNGLMGVWHEAGGENPLRSHPNIMDQWYCVEMLFDGSKTDFTKWYIDGKEVEYYMGEPNNSHKPKTFTQYDTLTVGITPYSNLPISSEKYGADTTPRLTDMWIDDIAFDTKRIGCIAGPVGQ
jgi:hypothetical protein